ncbi:FBP domain-containing protein [Nocardioides litoris]|uniref:FBP domain-containing protein n=1 Tax=Nocardioides litoris TaxID=1926648 RepID=UPI0011214144|nr:FBP domain-containing protein [Nocardioides litoris]
MDRATPREIRASFVNATRGEAQRLNLPDDLADLPWGPDLDFLGWADPRAPQQAALVVLREGRLVGVRLRRNNGGGGGRTRMCSLCCTVHPGSNVALMVAARAGKAGRDGNTVGLDVCADLRCPGYVRGWLPLPAISLVAETTTVEAKVERMNGNLDAFLRRVQR